MEAGASHDRTPGGDARLPIHMTQAEADLFRAFLGAATAYFEFGVGGSTVAASDLVGGPLYAVESDQGWIDRVSPLLAPGDGERRLIAVDIGPTGDWGRPVSDDGRARFPSYSGALAACGRADFDLCLIDGRFRVACFLQAIRVLRPDAVICVHDYRSRAQYHVMEEFGRPIAEVEDITFFVRRPKLDGRKLRRLLGRYAFDFA